jgi:hypothetical protein
LKTPLNVSDDTITHHQKHKQLYLQHHEIRTLIGLMLRNFRTEFHENTTPFQTSSLKFAQIEKQISKDRPAYFISLLKPTGHVTHQQFNIQNCTLCSHCIYVSCISLRAKSDLRYLHHKLISFYNPDEKCLLRGSNWGFK